MADYILVSGTTKKITSNTGGSRYVVESGGVLAISSGGTLWQSTQGEDHLIVYEGAVKVYAGGIAQQGTFMEHGFFYVYSGGTYSY